MRFGSFDFAPSSPPEAPPGAELVVRLRAQPLGETEFPNIGSCRSLFSVRETTKGRARWGSQR